MKYYNKILMLLLVINFVLLPNTCLAVANPEIYIINHREKICGYITYNYFSFLQYNAPENWENSPVGGDGGIIKEYCQRLNYKYVGQVVPIVAGLNSTGYFLIFLIIMFSTGFLYFMFWALKKR